MVINEDPEAIILILVVDEESIEVAAAAISKICTGMRVELVVGSTIILAMLPRNTLPLSNNIRHILDRMKVLPSTMHLRRMKRIARTSSDPPPKTFKWRIRKPPRRKTRSKCHLPTDHRRPALRASRILPSLALHSRLHQKPLQLHPNPKSLKN